MKQDQRNVALSIIRQAESTMNPLQQPFKFPKKLWLVISSTLFLYLLLTVRIGYPSKFPHNFTAWRAFLEGDIYLGVVVSLFWLGSAFALGAFVAAIVGILRPLLRKSK